MMDVSSSSQPNKPDHKRVIRKTLATIGIATLLAIPALLLVELQRSTNARMLQIGDSVPAAALSGLDTGKVLASGAGQRCTAILFFSVDCPRCQDEIPLFAEAARRFGSEVEFVAIALNGKKKTEAFVTTHKVGTKVLVDERGTVGKQFGISELPTIFLVNQDRTIAWVGVGEQSKTALFRRLTALLDKDQATSTDGDQRNPR